MQFLRPEKSVDTGEYKTLNELSEDSQNTVLKAGQPFYDIKNNKLYIGDGETKLANLPAASGTAGAQGPTGAEGLGIFRSSASTSTNTTSIQISSIKIPEGRSIKVGDLIIGNSTYSYLYRVTAVSSTAVTVEYLNSIRGSIGNSGSTGPAGPTGPAGTAIPASTTSYGGILLSIDGTSYNNTATGSRLITFITT